MDEKEPSSNNLHRTQKNSKNKKIHNNNRMNQIKYRRSIIGGGGGCLFVFNSSARVLFFTVGIFCDRNGMRDRCAIRSVRHCSKSPVYWRGVYLYYVYKVLIFNCNTVDMAETTTVIAPVITITIMDANATSRRQMVFPTHTHISVLVHIYWWWPVVDSSYYYYMGRRWSLLLDVYTTTAKKT